MLMPENISHIMGICQGKLLTKTGKYIFYMLDYVYQVQGLLTLIIIVIMWCTYVVYYYRILSYL